MNRKLRDYAFNKYSQFGEDGIIEKIFDEIGTTSRVCVEFGAWDGLHLSNTAKLWTTGWKAILIEGHKRRFAALVKNVARYDVTCINAYVGHQPADCLDALLASHNISAPLDLLSIDIDGDDYYVLQSLRGIRPRVVLCEYNPSVPAEVDLCGGPGDRFGASVTALVRVAGEKGYRLVAVTDTNCVFVRQEEFGQFATYETDLGRIKVDSHLVYLMTNYAGDYVASAPGPFGVAFPYRGELSGPHCRIRPQCAFLVPLVRLRRRLRSLLG